jgi:hypothetical protein
MAQARAHPQRRPTVDTSTAIDDKLKAEQGKSSAMPVPETPMEGPSTNLPAREGAKTGSQQPYDDAPPSYEDAIATDLTPVDGPRPNYQVRSGVHKCSLRPQQLFLWHAPPGEHLDPVPLFETLLTVSHRLHSLHRRQMMMC